MSDSHSINLSNVLSEITALFKVKGMNEARRQAEYLLCDLLDCSPSQLLENQYIKINNAQQGLARKWAERRLHGEPLAYLSGQVQFYGCRLKISPAVLIPRQETEILVDQVISTLKNEELIGKCLWDICCGSGCIGIALKKRFPALTVILSDCSPDALTIASRNAAANGVEVTCLCGDLFTPFQGTKAHYVVSNPPYVSNEEYAALAHEVKDFEPHLALVGGETGLEFYKRFSQELAPFLHRHAKVWLEIGYQQGNAVKSLFNSPPWKNQFVENDWAGHNRFFFLENE